MTTSTFRRSSATAARLARGRGGTASRRPAPGRRDRDLERGLRKAVARSTLAPAPPTVRRGRRSGGPFIRRARPRRGRVGRDEILAAGGPRASGPPVLPAAQGRRHPLRPRSRRPASSGSASSTEKVGVTRELIWARRQRHLPPRSVRRPVQIQRARFSPWAPAERTPATSAFRFGGPAGGPPPPGGSGRGR